MNPQFSRLVRNRAITERIVWAIITGSVVFYFFIAYVLTGESPGAGVEALKDAEPLFYAAAAAVAAFSVYYRRRSFSDDRIKVLLREFDTGVFPEHNVSDRPGRDGRDGLSALKDSEKRAVFLMNELQKSSIINLILNEFVIMIGFALSFLSCDFMKIIPFGAASLVLCIWMFPRTESVIDKTRITIPE